MALENAIDYHYFPSVRSMHEEEEIPLAMQDTPSIYPTLTPSAASVSLSSLRASSPGFAPSQQASVKTPSPPMFTEFPFPKLSLAHTELVDVVPAAEQYALPSIHQSEDFFLEDASLVLISEDNVAFAIHRSILRRHSGVLHEKFEIRAKVPESEMYKGLPFVQLDESAEVVKTFLQIVYDQKPIELIEHAYKLLAFCDKYAFDCHVKKILPLLSKTYPDTLEAWDRPRDSDKIKEAINVAIAASRSGMKTLIPSCLYTIMSSSAYERDLQKLPQPLLLQFHHGSVHFSTYVIDFYDNTWTGRKTPPRGCHKKAKCRDAWVKLRDFVVESFLHNTGYIRSPKPLEFLQKLSDMAMPNFASDSYCTKCQISLSDVIGDAQKEVWNSLPRIFKVADSWEELRREGA